MAGKVNRVNVRTISQGTREHFCALHRVLGYRPPPAGAAPARPVADLLAGASRGRISIDLFFGVYDEDNLLAACLAVESP